MIVEEYPLENKEYDIWTESYYVVSTIDTLVRHYSDQHYVIRQIETGNLYAEAIDIYPCPYTYEETDQKLTEYEYENEIKDFI